LIDAVSVKQQAIISQKLIQYLASKGVPVAMSAVGTSVSGVTAKAIGAGAGQIAGVISAAFTGLDVGHSLGKFLTSADNLIDETTQLINYLEQSEGVKGTEWSKLNRRMQTKLSGSVYIIEKGLNELRSNTISEKKLTEQNIRKLINNLKSMSKISQGILNISEVCNILKQNKTRELYIKHSKGNFLNIYNAMMDYVAKIESMLMQVKRELIPYSQNIEQFKNMMEELKPLVEDAAEEIKEGKVNV
jgi:hypothetical protein